MMMRSTLCLWSVGALDGWVGCVERSVPAILGVMMYLAGSLNLAGRG